MTFGRVWKLVTLSNEARGVAPSMRRIGEMKRHELKRVWSAAQPEVERRKVRLGGARAQGSVGYSRLLGREVDALLLEMITHHIIHRHVAKLESLNFYLFFSNPSLLPPLHSINPRPVL